MKVSRSTSIFELFKTEQHHTHNECWLVTGSNQASFYSFSSAISYARCDPTKGYHWEFPNDKSPKVHKKQPSQKEEPSDVQRRKVDSLLMDLVRKFPPKAFARKVSTPLTVVVIWKDTLPLFFYHRMETNHLLVRKYTL